MRKALKNVQFSDGTFIPKGTCLVSASGAMHHDEKHYLDPEVFDPFRFSRMREQHGDNVKHRVKTTSATYLPWGYGPHAWYVAPKYYPPPDSDWGGTHWVA